MSIKSILVSVDEREVSVTALAVAMATARSFGAHIEALHVRPDPRDSIPYMTGVTSADAIAMVVEGAERAADERAAAARALYDLVRGRDEIPVVETPAAATAPSIAWREETGRATEVVARRGRANDLVVAVRPDEHAPAMVESVLFDSGTPVLLVPPGSNPALEGVAAVGWNGSPEAARALARGLPFLAVASHAVVLSAREGAEPYTDPADAVARLAWHGIAAEARLFEPGRRSVAEALLAEAEAAGAGLLILGGYGHSRVRELVLGGVTRDILAEARLPVLLAH